MLKPDVPTVVCARTSDVPAGTPVPPIVQPVDCAGCGCRVLASLSSRKLIERGYAQPVCKGCVPAGRTVAVMSEEQWRECQRFLAEDALKN